MFNEAKQLGRISFYDLKAKGQVSLNTTSDSILLSLTRPAPLSSFPLLAAYLAVYVARAFY